MRVIIAPHVDDDVIGAGGQLGGRGTTEVIYIGVDEFHVVSEEERYKEAEAVVMAADGSMTWPRHHRFKVNHYRENFSELVTYLEGEIHDIAPQEIMTAWPSYNQDHQAVYDALMVALRPHDKIPFVPRVLLYEEPDCFWPRLGAPFVPNLFRPIDIERKLALYALMPSQVRGMRSPEHLRALAAVRGAACNVPYAEAFHILRWVE